MSTAPDLPGSLYGLRSWRVAKGDDGEWLTGVVHGPRWPAAGEWLAATCEMGGGHAAPQADCTCGLHALHPRLASARRVMSARGQVAGVMEAAGRVEVHVDGLRAERARVHALAAPPNRNVAQIERLAARYGVPVIRIRRPADLLSWCTERGLGLDPGTVAALLGPGPLRAARVAVRRRALRLVAVVALTGALLGGGLALSSAVPKGKVIKGRAGTFTVR